MANAKNSITSKYLDASDYMGIVSAAVPNLLIKNNHSVFETKIWHIWMQHNDPEVENAMFQGLEALKLQLFEKAFSHFSLLIKLAPDYAEGWNKRAKRWSGVFIH